MPDRLALWDRLLTLTTKSQEAVDVFNALPNSRLEPGMNSEEEAVGGQIDKGMDKSNEKGNFGVEMNSKTEGFSAKLVMSGLLHLLFSSKFNSKSDEAVLSGNVYGGYTK